MKNVHAPRSMVKTFEIEANYVEYVVRFGHENMARLRARSKRKESGKRYDRRDGQKIAA